MYSLTLTQSTKAPETVLKLSELMSYVIYEGKSNRVKLSKEVKHIHDYLDLEKLRYSNRLETTINIKGKIDNYYMPPLILVPFIENCFKHGNTEADNIPININLSVIENTLHYKVKNNLKPNEGTNKKGDNRGGIGIKNATRRLNLLYKNNYSLEIQRDKETFTIELIMPLYDKKLNS